MYIHTFYQFFKGGNDFPKTGYMGEYEKVNKMRRAAKKIGRSSHKNNGMENILKGEIFPN